MFNDTMGAPRKAQIGHYMRKARTRCIIAEHAEWSKRGGRGMDVMPTLKQEMICA